MLSISTHLSHTSHTHLSHNSHTPHTHTSHTHRHRPSSGRRLWSREGPLPLHTPLTHLTHTPLHLHHLFKKRFSVRLLKRTYDPLGDKRPLFPCASKPDTLFVKPQKCGRS